jgi:predicted helicase
MHNFGKSTQQSDPIIHFYETFLAEYDPKLRKSRGVWYTPEPVVSFIVRAVDDILKTQFKLPQGLADTSKTKVTIEATEAGSKGKLVKRELELHRVQILDPATGTGTFLAQTIRHIYDSQFSSMQGVWSEYVKKDLIPRLNGFEILMTSYAMAHLKLDMLLTETGYKPEGNAERLRVYLTNSLEEHHPDTGTLFAGWLSTEANEANHIKRDAPVMVVMGNPPYSGVSSNNGEWIAKLIEDYKYIDGEHFNERKHWLNDDYVKFIRYGQHFIDKNGEGVLAFINNHSFLDNPTFRAMRWNLLSSFDEIYVLDLHGNAKKKEVSPDGSKDENVFDIQQGVSITFFVKTGRKNEKDLGVVYHSDIYGSRKSKYEFLTNNSWKEIQWNKIEASAPNYFFIPKDFLHEEEYVTGFKLGDLFLTTVSGIVTARDPLVIDFNKKDLIAKIDSFATSSKEDEEVRNHLYGNKKAGKYLAGDSRGWKLSIAREKIRNNIHSKIVKSISYRPFDVREIYYSPDMVDWGRREAMQHMLANDNLSVVFLRQYKTGQNYQHVFITNLIFESCLVSNRTSEICYGAPLYLYSNERDLLSGLVRTPNLNSEIVDAISNKLGIKFVSEKEVNPEKFAPIDLLDYIYAVLHSPTYRETYKEFLKIDFPRVPYPKNVTQFWQLVGLGCELRQLHLLEGSVINQCITRYPQSGSNLVDKLQYEDGKVYINDTQYFEGVPQIAWEFYIGGYQPAQKWLKSRKGRTLGHEDISHYQKIIKAMVETDRLMQVIDKIDII